MKSAYVVLGIPGNANEEEIREAFERARAFYTKEKMVENPELMERYAELREAHKILTTPDLRQLHDRKLASGVVSRVRPTRIEVVEEQPSGMGTLKIMGVVVVLMFAIGTYYSEVRETARKERAAAELALQKKTQEEEQKAERERREFELQKAHAAALADRKEQQLRADSQMLSSQITARHAAAAAVQERNAQMERNAAAQAERQRRSEAQQRIADDQRQLRNICMQTYGRPNC